MGGSPGREGGGGGGGGVEEIADVKTFVGAPQGEALLFAHRGIQGNGDSDVHVTAPAHPSHRVGPQRRPATLPIVTKLHTARPLSQVQGADRNLGTRQRKPQPTADVSG